MTTSSSKASKPGSSTVLHDNSTPPSTQPPKPAAKASTTTKKHTSSRGRVVHTKATKSALSKPSSSSSPRSRDNTLANTPLMPPAAVQTATPAELLPWLHKIATATHRSPFERRVWTLLLQIPPGSFSTYGLMAAHLGSSPRAVGNALRRNPFAPEVPCHRVVATGGGMGGFKGKSGKEGEGTTLIEKRSLLRGEGVKFDAKGGVLGTPFRGFV